MHPSYIPPSPQVRLDHQSLAPQKLSCHSSYRPSTLSNRPQLKHQTPMNHHLPFDPYRSSSMASTAPPPADTSPLWLEPSPQHRQARNDPFFSTRARGYGPTSSPSRFALGKGPTTSFEPTAPSYQSNTMGNHVPNLSSEKSEDRTSRYNLTIRQQPINCRACGMGERDRRLIDPPPIVQLSLNNFDPTSAADVNALKTNFNVLHCSLIDSSGADITQARDPHDPKKMSRRLTGSLIASQFVGTDPDAPASSIPNARLGCFFIFPDLSCRQTGVYRLRFTLMQLNVGILPTGSSSNLMIQVVDSNPFEVFTPKEFPGLKASNDLMKELKRQGATVTIRKGHDGKADGKGQQHKGGSSGSGDETSEKGQEPATAAAATTAAPRRRRH
ncbi:hypothetical protein XANCAGTX0491_007183 [Xanthoria calcicola]